ncbi:autoinducer 2 ABC transporter substrate-binding protein, partial [Salmonella enterica subsp. enterica serovar 1,4,[5],12:i:-]|nr:autoinducer 2 ABC transporter substrate-binding protein [Salmonella enterica subsp. enterica serovar 1,4,[5],12:i:-]
VKSGDIAMGVTYDPGSAGYAMTAVADKVLKGEKIETGMEIPGVGKAEVDQAKHLIQFHNVLRVTKDNVDSLY